MPRLLVTPLSGLSQVLADHAPSHLVSLLSPDHMIETPAGFPAARHLKIGVNDIVDPLGGTAPPGPHHIAALLDFTRSWDGTLPMVIHCWAGISRSMASAFTVLCDRLGQAREEEIARAIRSRAPHAQPNRLLVQHADVALGRCGRMVRALDSMGPPHVMEEGVIAVFPLEGL